MEEWVKKDNETIVVEAVRLNEDNAAEVAAWCAGVLIEEIDPQDSLQKQPGINVPTPAGFKRASLGMYVINYGAQFFVETVRRFELLYTPRGRYSPPPESSGDTRHRLGFRDPFGGTLGGRPM